MATAPGELPDGDGTVGDARREPCAGSGGSSFQLELREGAKTILFLGLAETDLQVQ